MAKGEQITSLIRAFRENDHERFIATATQLAAHEEKMGHGAVAYAIRQLLSTIKKPVKPPPNISFISPCPSSLVDFALTCMPEEQLSELIIPRSLKKSIEKILLEYRQRAKLYAYDLLPRRHLLLYGPPGTGKTLTAKVIAGELHLPLHTVLMDRLLTKFMGESSIRIRQIFSLMEQERGVYLFDEFDAIGGNRSQENEVGEMRRVVNTFLQMLDNDRSDSIIIAATNDISILDHALFRRFDDVLSYSMPDRQILQGLLQMKLGMFWNDSLAESRIVEMAVGLSHAEISGACFDAKKDAVLGDRCSIRPSELEECLLARRAKYESWK